MGTQSQPTNQHDSWFWREVAVAHDHVAGGNVKQITVASEGEGLVAVVMFDEATDSVLISVITKTGREATVTKEADNATDRT
jgi:ribosome-interacting GTPase 1